jgi:hypothetical protein
MISLRAIVAGFVGRGFENHLCNKGTALAGPNKRQKSMGL